LLNGAESADARGSADIIYHNVAHIATL